MPHTPHSLNRRDFLKVAALGLGGLALTPPRIQDYALPKSPLPQFPAAERLGRVCRFFSKAEIKEKPDDASATVKTIYEDTVVPWLSEVAGARHLRNNQRYVETPEGYIWSADLQPVRNQPNQPLLALPETNNGQGMWVEVTIPYTDILIDNPPFRSPILRNGAPSRLYYSQIIWVDNIRQDENGQVWYRINERYGSYGDIFWAPAEAFRPLQPDELAPIHPDAPDKRIEVDVDWKRQTLSCFEGDREVYFCLVSSGVEDGSTPLGEHTIWRKLVSLHMSGGTAIAGWDLLGIGWTTLFVGEGVAIHSTYWHNNFGEPESHGCVNVAPEDAKWIFRWALPAVPIEPGEVTVQGFGSSTKVKVVSGA